MLVEYRASRIIPFSYILFYSVHDDYLIHLGTVPGDEVEVGIGVGVTVGVDLTLGARLLVGLFPSPRRIAIINCIYQAK
ncbi:MAG: hypothetical protein KME30_25640 [Iphinoe sp. HA4291-MV1]|jgi:hypothetical protein|nr:hypothetical protein [Iphinoe sp. HA4291-MV1]